jgi:hypothetical protein
MTRKIFSQVLAYLFTFWLGAKMVILSNLDILSIYDWISLGLTILFTAHFVNEANK